MKDLLKELLEDRQHSAKIEKVKPKEHLIADAVFFRNKGNLVKVKWSDILWLKGDGNYTTVVTRHQTYSLRNILKEFETILPKDEFFRIHKSYIVRLDEIVSINPRALTVGGDSVPVGRTYFQDLIDGIVKLGSNT